MSGTSRLIDLMRYAGSVLVLLVFARYAAAASGGGLRDILQAKYDASCAAVGRKDATGEFALCAPEWVFVEASGKVVPLATLRAAEATKFGRCDSIRASVKILDLERSGADAARTRVLSVNEYHLREASGKPHVFTTRSTERDTWVRRNGEWWVVRTQSLGTSKAFLDGKPQ